MLAGAGGHELPFAKTLPKNNTPSNSVLNRLRGKAWPPPMNERVFFFIRIQFGGGKEEITSRNKHSIGSQPVAQSGLNLSNASKLKVPSQANCSFSLYLSSSIYQIMWLPNTWPHPLVDSPEPQPPERNKGSLPHKKRNPGSTHRDPPTFISISLFLSTKMHRILPYDTQTGHIIRLN